MKKANILSVSRLVLASSLAILPLAISSTSYVQAAESQEQQVTATVKPVLKINVPNTTSFNADSESASSKSFEVNVRSNHKNGYAINVYSENGGVLKNSDDSAKFEYTLSTNGGAEVTPGKDNGSKQTLYKSDTFAKEPCILSACSLKVSLNYDISTLQLPTDSYTDKITYEILAK